MLGPHPRAPLVSQELQLREAQNENARLVEENSRLNGRATEKEQVASLPRCGGAWAPARPWSLVRDYLLHPLIQTGPEYEGYCFPGKGAGETGLTLLAHGHSLISRWSGRMQS